MLRDCYFLLITFVFLTSIINSQDVRSQRVVFRSCMRAYVCSRHVIVDSMSTAQLLFETELVIRRNKIIQLVPSCIDCHSLIFSLLSVACVL